MKVLLPLLVFLLFVVSPIAAQETPEPTDWTIEQRCITAPSQPPEGWMYDGVIYTFMPDDGIHARRADMNTPYYVAFDSDSEFGVAGSFSPDGKWFAVPEGNTYPDFSGFRYSLRGYTYVVDQIRVYSTTPEHGSYAVRVEYTSDAAVRTVEWIDNQTLVFEEGYFVYSVWSRIVIFNPFSQTHEIVEEWPVIPDSPDGTRAIKFQVEANNGYHSLVFLDDPKADETRLDIFRVGNRFSSRSHDVLWTFDSSSFAAEHTDWNSIDIFDRNGQLQDVVPLEGLISDFRFAPNGKHLAFVQREGTIHIVDLATRTITDTCIETPYSMAFSPDGRQLAFGLEPAGYTYILDLAAWQAYRIDLAAADVVGWYSLDE